MCESTLKCGTVHKPFTDSIFSFLYCSIVKNYCSTGKLYNFTRDIKKKGAKLGVAFNVLCGNHTTLLYKKELTNNGLNCYFKISLKTGSVFSQIGTVLRDEFWSTFQRIFVKANSPRSIYENSNMTPRLSGFFWFGFLCSQVSSGDCEIIE